MTLFRTITLRDFTPVIRNPPRNAVRDQIQAEIRKMSELFPVEVSLSPRLRWLERHGLTLRRQAGGRWECYLDDDNRAADWKKDDACAKFCRKTGIPHWLDPKDGIV